uniref:Uncharacterized protein n=1 Tax=Amphimedon queenslandica TaxID=400682 RepID=A0A1X7VTS1_AMPQE
MRGSEREYWTQEKCTRVTHAQREGQKDSAVQKRSAPVTRTEGEGQKDGTVQKRSAPVEAPIAVNDVIESIISSDVLPPILTPINDRKRARGKFLRIGDGSDTYVFSFDKPVPGTQAKLEDHFLS